MNVVLSVVVLFLIAFIVILFLKYFEKVRLLKNIKETYEASKNLIESQKELITKLKAESKRKD